MLCQAVLTSVLFHVTLGLTQHAVQFGVEYFQYRGLKFICVMTCDRYFRWTVQYSKASQNHSMAISGVSINSFMIDYNRVENCLRRKLHPVGVIVDAGCGGTEDVMDFVSI
ncbi:hypothetical protein HF086_007860 [Spodoptera exigua]|uniref:Uncharacterized protein n=1 Tax=Spodoptera exigua TaxID=7107 RepID=A0A922S8W0_SPOEX|nr:hypothetical protein HF086_007860 [Spodoptera exigua]